MASSSAAGSEVRRIGILGAGRLGQALATRLADSFEIAIHDTDPKRGEQVASQLGVRLLPQDELLDFSELLLLCIPPPEVPRFFQALPPERTRHPVYLNTATDVDTPELVKSLGLERLKVIGLKPLGQFVAMRQRIPLTFITSCTDADDLRRLEQVLGRIGTIRTGDERNVGPLNHLATRLALRFAQTFSEEVRRYTEDPEWVASALRSVVVGTLLDYPPAADNGYTARILKDLAAEAKAPARPGRAKREVTLDVRVPGFDAFGGRHCETSALRKVLGYHGLHHSEELLFGLAGGIGFTYWQSAKLPVPFVGGRNGKFPDFVLRLGEALGLRIEVLQTDSAKKAYANLVSELCRSKPVICYGDIFFLPYFHARRHFGGHAFVVYGLNERTDEVLISDRGDQPRTVTLAELARSRGAKTPLFPPRNAQLRIHVSRTSGVRPEAARDAILRACGALRAPPNSNLGLAGLLTFEDRLSRAIRELPGPRLLELLLSTYVNLELAGTGGCAFRKMYRGFLDEARSLLPGEGIEEASSHLDRAISAWEALIRGLLPPALGPALAGVREALHAKEHAFEHGSMEEVREASRHGRRLESLWKEASAEVERGREALLAAPAHLQEIHRAEATMVETLAGELSGRETRPRRYG